MLKPNPEKPSLLALFIRAVSLPMTVGSRRRKGQFRDRGKGLSLIEGQTLRLMLLKDAKKI